MAGQLVLLRGTVSGGHASTLSLSPKFSLGQCFPRSIEELRDVALQSRPKHHLGVLLVTPLLEQVLSMTNNNSTPVAC